ncbi:winged helix-turn-helix transcriptional regulator [Mycobacterium sp.]|uniref:winged helix-turn-helix transcriptional regulator n=1 Tax=Mycobacterium sp. TaxID=1785 RepID=UPI002D93000C|nr:helix-turn-helix domain-containing protein [Mycobacterium sp.]
MVGRRRYDEGCAVAHALDLIGERWAMLIVRELLLGPKRFTDLRAGMPGASADVLALRLREMTESGVVRRRKLPPPAGSEVYELTEWGADLEPIVTHLGRWGSRSSSLNPTADSSVDSVVLSLRALFNPQAAKRFSATIRLRLSGNEFTVEVAEGQLRVARGEAEHPTATLDTDRPTLAALLYGGRPLDDAVRAGDATVGGKPDVVKRFLALFPLPTAH